VTSISPWLSRALEESRARGFLGPNALEPHVAHALGFATVWEGLRQSPPANFLDLGSGGGLPGLVILDRWQNPATLLDAMTKRATFLEEVLAWDGAPTSAQVVIGRAEELAYEKDLQGGFELVTSRSFGPPAVTAECAARFLAVGGVLIVSEPPDAQQDERWPEKGLHTLGLARGEYLWVSAGFQVIHKVEETPSQYPRNNGTPGKHPLF